MPSPRVPGSEHIVIQRSTSILVRHHKRDVYTYLNYGGNCREAFEFYVAHLGAKIEMIVTHGDHPNASQAPNWKDAVLHARLSIGDTVLLGADVPPDRFKPMRSAYLTLMLDSIAQAERVYVLLIESGEIFMPIQETFYAHRFAMLRDRFGTAWMLLQEREPA